jgi:hypothetical protein
MILIGKIIRHKRAMDVAFDISKRFDTGPIGRRFKLKGHWINMGFDESYVIMPDKIEIQYEDLENWEYCLNPFEKCIRKSLWASAVAMK